MTLGWQYQPDMVQGEEIHHSYFVLDRASYNQGKNALYDIKIVEGGAIPALVARGPHAIATQNIG